MRALSIHAHPDDAEFLCAGTLALLQRRGWEVGLLVACRGDCGSAVHGPDEIAAIRLEEGRHAAAMIGATYENLGVGDLQLLFDNPTRRLVTEAVRRFRPDLVFAPCAEDYMPDHLECGRLASDAAFNAALPNYATGVERPAPHTPHIPHVYYCDPIELKDRWGNGVAPAICVDIGAEVETKAEMLGLHVSQREWLLQHHGMDQYLDTMRGWASKRGALVGVKAAEGFRQHLGHPFPHSDILTEVLGDLVHPVA